MEKLQYVNPETEMVSVQQQSQILTGSPFGGAFGGDPEEETMV